LKRGRPIIGDLEEGEVGTKKGASPQPVHFWLI